MLFSVRIRTRTVSERVSQLAFDDAIVKFKKSIERKDLQGKLGTAALFDEVGKLLAVHRFDLPGDPIRDYRGRANEIRQPKRGKRKT